MANSPLLKKATSSRESIKSTPGQPSVTSDRAPSAAAPSNVLQLQRTAGNRAAQANVKQLQGDGAAAAGGSQAIASWLKAEAAKDKKSDLFAFFEALSTTEQKIVTHLCSGGTGSSSLSKAKKHITGFTGRSVDWDKFSKIVRTVKGQNTKNYNDDTDRDYVTYATTAAAASVGAASATATSVSTTQGLVAGAAHEGALGAVTDIGPAAAMLSGVTSGMQIYNATQNHDEALSTHDKAQNIGGEGFAGVADLTRFGAQSVVNTQTYMGAAVSTAATAAAGAAGVVGGAAYLASGAAGVYTHGKRKKNLEKLEKETAGKDANLNLAANIGASTQEINRKKSGATALKGAAMIVGGGLLLASAATPVGWLLLGVAGAIGGIAAIYKFYKKRTRKEEIVDRFLGVDKKVAELQAADPKAKPDKSVLRNGLLQQNGFNSVAQCYAQIITDLAHTIYKKGVLESDPQYVTLITNIGLKPDPKKKTPKADLIAKKLHT
ncbi:hypothetical protein FHS16_002814 [Paenibacillus endophyticus]|uniref:Uncharacterized protein n=1 Tax=Paenibacillus endophyticus TaxID=1294268 RepID=A0A7W5GBA7_9BACL|nr:hypothetical protein [Paenibacillus endophyticus]MBB3152757.1 hypothetical protein [Paenibacillus endophyticus]